MIKTVFVLGSGFSKDIADYPTLSNLSQKVEEQIRNENENGISKVLSQFLLNSVPENIFRNVEHLMSFLLQDYPWRTYQEKNLCKAAYFYVVQVVQSVLIKHDADSRRQIDSNEDAKNLVQKWHEGKSTIITFNYDTVVESLIRLHLSGESIHLEDVYQIPVAHVCSRTNALWGGENHETFKLLKLHGSINWYHSGSVDYHGEQIFYEDLAEERKNEREIAERNKIDLVPLMIPPVLDKSAFYSNNGIKTQWQLSKNAIMQANAVYFIGYSLPLTDLTTQFLFNEALTVGKPKLFVVVKEDDEDTAKKIQDRYLQLVGKDTDRLLFENVKDSSLKWLIGNLNESES